MDDRESVRSSFYHRVFAGLLSHGAKLDRPLYGERKAALMAGLRGEVLDIGAGAGVNLKYLDPSIRYTAVEPNVHMHRHIREAAERAGIEAVVLAGIAESLPFDDSSFDAVIGTLVLCSVDDVRAALDEIRRVLRPGGRFVFLEHVAARPGTLLRRMQRVIRRPWGCIADGCRPDRETDRLILESGFGDVEIERFRKRAGPVSPHVCGVATTNPGASRRP
jgi:ubiquinone/menaquinone biosynthesis C-methylase UbiE